MIEIKQMKIHKVKAFEGTHNAKEMENQLFNLEQYFLLANTNLEEAKVIMASIYLSSDAKL